MNTFTTVLLIVLAVILVGLVVLFFVGRKMMKKQEDAQATMQSGAQTYSILVIDKKKMKLKEANLPKIVLEQTPKYLRNSKVPIVKAKIGPKVTTLICDAKIYDLIPVKKEIKAVMNGLYIMDVKGLRSGLDAKPEKQGFFKKMKNKLAKNKE